MRSKTDEFAREVTKPGDLPELLRAVYAEALHEGPCMLAIYAPALSNLPPRHRQPPASYLMMVSGDHIFVAGQNSSRDVAITRLMFEDVLCVELGQVLLFCWMRIVFGRSLCQEIKIPFNLVKLTLFQKALQIIRSSLDRKLEGQHIETPKLLDLDFKFKNVLHELRFPDEILLDVAFQPEVRTRRLFFLERQVVPPLLAALTTCQFLLVTEEPPASVERIGRFSDVYTYCPHDRIDSLTIEPDEDERFARLSLTLRNGTVRLAINSVFAKELRPKFNELCDSVFLFMAQRSASVLARNERVSDVCHQIN